MLHNLWLIASRMSRRSLSPQLELEVSLAGNDVRGSRISRSSLEDGANPEDHAALSKPLAQMTYLSPSAHGGFTDVWKGILNGCPVAIKVLRVYDTRRNFERHKHIFQQEIVSWRQLSHPNLLPLLGVSDLGDGTLPALVSPWLENGNITQFLRTTSSQINRSQLMLDVARGLSYLHGHNVVHGDLKSANILIDSHHRACLADFGLTKVLPCGHRGIDVTGGLGSARYQAPELLLGDTQHATQECDVYSFGVVCYEILSDMQPFSDLATNVDIVLAHYEKGKPFTNANKRLFECPAVDEALWDLLSSCWDCFPSKRPKMNAVLCALAAIEEESDLPLRQTRL
ncbi:putative protein tyrosine kinase [Lyophyllum shimeji]|uniref:Protein kinase domain-containing protein n=1 Tax=Lyophyllum shimeji TaxID=47721 RepID=A0A9P3PX35_LYOSH|nr:putative protein tyrosine kinase [Lyophyllum shimeji]